MEENKARPLIPPELADKVDPIALLDFNPTNSTVVSPDGRVFTNIPMLVSAMGVDVMLNTFKVQAEPDSDEKTLKLTFLSGQKDILVALVKTNDQLQAHAMEQKLEREGINGEDSLE